MSSGQSDAAAHAMSYTDKAGRRCGVMLQSTRAQQGDVLGISWAPGTV